MNVYEFEKSLLQRLEESTNVLHLKNAPVSAAEVRGEWAYFVELQIEPAGWQALWKISRVTCEALRIKYPTVVYGTINNVSFSDLTAEFQVSAVQDDDVHLPELHEVPLEDLWPTKDQENEALNIERTADCVDQLRFFYRNVWMPWDTDADDLNWAEKHLDSRIRFCFDLKRGMSRALADHIRVQLVDARYIQSRLDRIEMDLSDDEDLDEAPNKNQITDLMKMHLRLAVIKNEIELLENPEMRQIYEEINFPAPKSSSTSTNVYIVTKEDTIDKQIEYLNAAKATVGSSKSVKIVISLIDCFKICSSADQIYIPTGQHPVKCLESLNANGAIRAITDVNNRQNASSEIDAKRDAIVVAAEDDNVLMTFNGEYTFENVTFDCRNVRVGLLVRAGCVTLKNCLLIGEPKSSTGNGIVILDGAAVHLENCHIRDFGEGIVCGAGGVVQLMDSVVSHCRIGIGFRDKSVVRCQSTRITNCEMFGAVYEAVELVMEEKKVLCAEGSELVKLLDENNRQKTFAGECSFKSNGKGNIIVFNRDQNVVLQNSAFIEESDLNESVSIDGPALSEMDASGDDAPQLNGSVKPVSSSACSELSEASIADDEDIDDSVIIIDSP